jgi:hypothetical protein
MFFQTMDNLASSSSSSSKPFQFQGMYYVSENYVSSPFKHIIYISIRKAFNFSLNENENPHQAIDTQQASLKGKQPKRPRTLKSSSKRTSNDSASSWVFTGSIKSSESSDNSSNEGPSRRSSSGVIKHNSQQAPSNERFLILLKRLNPDVPLSDVTELNLSKQDIKKFDNMDTHLVSLKKLILSDNQLTHVADMPTSLTCLNLTRNK